MQSQFAVLRVRFLLEIALFGSRYSFMKRPSGVGNVH
jgi:hypothetical protein